MREVVIGKNEAGQRLDKFLGKYLNLAPKSFFYKMMRKKNITLNGKKCEGSEKLNEGDLIKLFLADETLDKFSEVKIQKIQHKQKKPLDILYEDEHIVLINKPSGMLSQKAKESDVSLVEYLIDHLLESGSLTEAEMKSFRPSICNRLDRNTSGIVAAGKSLAGLQMLSEVFRDRSIHKYYQCIVEGEMKESRTIDGWLLKDERSNKVRILTDAEAKAWSNHQTDERSGKQKTPAPSLSEQRPLAIKTRYEPISTNGRYTRLKVTLFTGRSHQIRAHLASIGHPIVGDPKYGTSVKKANHVKGQLLHSFRLEFPVLPEPFSYLSERVFEAPLPEEFQPFVEMMK